MQEKLIYSNYIHKHPNCPDHASILTKMDNGIIQNHVAQISPTEKAGKVVTEETRQRRGGKE